MALPKKQTKERLLDAGVSEDKVDSVLSWILDGHTASMDALKEQLETANANAQSLADITKERDTFKAQVESLTKAGSDAAKVQAEFDTFKAQVETEKANAVKVDKVRSAIKAAGARESVIDLLMRGIDLDKVEMDGDSIKDAAALVGPIKTQYADCFGTVQPIGTPPITPPTGGEPTPPAPSSLVGALKEKFSKGSNA